RAFAIPNQVPRNHGQRSRFIHKMAQAGIIPAMNAVAWLLRRTYGMLARVFPQCSVIAQAIAFNLFLAFFPALLIAVALATTRIGGRTSLFELIRDLTEFLP